MIIRALVLGLAMTAPGLVFAQAPVAETFRRDVAAVMGEGQDLRVLLTEQNHGVAAQRTLAVGDAYRDGWILRQATAKAVVLAKGGNSVTVDLAARAPIVADAAPAAPGAVVGAALTNADKSGAPTKPADASPTPRPDLADLERRAAAGDERATYALQARESPDFEEHRARSIAAGRINSVRMNDGLEPLGPDVTPSRDAAAAGIDTTGYIVGYAPDGTELLYRTQALYDAAKRGP